MIVFSEKPPHAVTFRRQLIRMLPGAVIGLGLELALRWTSLSPAARLFVGTMPMFFLFGLLSPVASARYTPGRRARHAALYALITSTMLFGIMLL